MIDFPVDSFFENTLKPGKVYYFRSKNPKTDNKPRYYIVVTLSDSGTIILCTTTKNTEKRITHIKYNKLPYSTLVFIKPDNDNGLKVESAVDCNHCEREDKESLAELYKKRGIQFKGQINASKLEEIRQGLIDSPAIEEEVKEMVKNSPMI